MTKVQANVCEFCREHGPRWIRWLDRSVADYMRRVCAADAGDRTDDAFRARNKLRSAFKP